jgi:DNA-binding protein HU-beta
MNKAELVGAIADKSETSRVVVDLVVSSLLEVVKEQISAGHPVRLVGFGTFNLKQAKARQGRNPRTGEPIDIPARRVPHFKPGTGFKEAVRG